MGVPVVETMPLRSGILYKLYRHHTYEACHLSNQPTDYPVCLRTGHVPHYAMIHVHAAWGVIIAKGTFR